jgi:hypothetical protein
VLVAAAGASTFLKKKLAKFGALKTSNPQLQLALLPENEVLRISTDQSGCTVGYGGILRPDGAKRNTLMGSGIKF